MFSPVPQPLAPDRKSPLYARVNGVKCSTATIPQLNKQGPEPSERHAAPRGCSAGHGEVTVLSAGKSVFHDVSPDDISSHGCRKCVTTLRGDGLWGINSLWFSAGR